MIELADLYEMIEYDPVVGLFKWRKSHGFKKQGTSLAKTRITLHGQVYQGGPLAWFYTYGRWPGKYFAHLNGDRLDIRLTNLTSSKIYKRKPPIPADRLSVTIEKTETGFRVIHVIGRVSNDMGEYPDYDIASDIQRWLLC